MDPHGTYASTRAGNVPLRTPFFYGWVIVGLSFVTLAFHLTARFSFAIFQVPLIAEFGWTRGALGGAFALMMGTYALINPLTGALFERKGPRAVLPWGSVIVGIALAGGYFIGALWHVYLLTGLLLAVGTAMSGYSLHGALMPRWFERKLGLATGIIFSGIGIGGLILSPVIERLIAFFGWREAYLLYGLAVLLFLAPANFLLLRNRAEDVGLPLDGVPHEDPVKPETRTGHDHGVFRAFGMVKDNPRFWALALITFVIGLNNNTILSQIQLFLVDAKFSMANAAVILGATGFFRILGSVGTGWTSDRLGRPGTQALASAVSAAGVVLLLLIPWFGASWPAGYAFALICGFGMGGMSTCFSAMTADTFKGSSLAVVMGILEIFYGLGGVVGPPLAGLAFDLWGSYLVPFTIIILTLLAAIAVSLSAFRDTEGTR